MPGKIEKSCILTEASLFLGNNRDELASKVVKYYKRYIPAYSSFSTPDFLEEVREEICERITLMSKHLLGEKDIGHLSSEFFKKLVEKRLVQGIPFSELLGAYVVGKNIILNALKREFLPRALEKEEVFQFFQAVADATESVLIPMALTYEDTQEYLDNLTRCYNHSCFQEILHGEIEKAREEETPLSLILLDIDHFRRLSESHGYRQSDLVLRELSGLLKETLNGEDVIARYSADVFAIIMLRRPKEQALKMARKIRKLITEHDFYILENRIKKITVSLGVASFPDDCGNRLDLIDCALHALARAKEKGRNTVLSFKKT